MKTISKARFTLIPLIAFAITITLSNGIARGIDHHRAAMPAATDEPLSGSYHTMLESMNSISLRQ